MVLTSRGDFTDIEEQRQLTGHPTDHLVKSW